MVGEGTPFKPLYNKQAYTTPYGATPSVAGPGGGRMVMKSGSQGQHGSAVILNEFILEKIKRVAKEDPLKANRALSDLKWVLEDLVEIGHSEFKEAIKTIEAFDARMIESSRKRLVAAYRDPATPREDLDEINASLVDIIRAGSSWKEDIDSWGREDDDGCAA
jgi:hypothetical protein